MNGLPPRGATTTIQTNIDWTVTLSHPISYTHANGSHRPQPANPTIITTIHITHHSHHPNNHLCLYQDPHRRTTTCHPTHQPRLYPSHRTVDVIGIISQPLVFIRLHQPSLQTTLVLLDPTTFTFLYRSRHPIIISIKYEHISQHLQQL